MNEGEGKDGKIPENFLRDYQKKASFFTLSSLKNSGGAIVESPTGSGKTLMALVAALEYARQKGMKILYLTRTNSQQEQVMADIRKLKQFVDVKAMAVQGRGNMCPLYQTIEPGEDFTSESLSKMCSSRKKRVIQGDREACRFYNEEIKADSTKSLILDDTTSPEELYSRLVPLGICPYESVKYAMRDADLCIMPYSYFLNPGIAPSVLYNWRTSRDNLLIVMDEAHNIPELARNVFSFRITTRQISLVEKEAVEFGDPEILPSIRPTDICEYVRNAIIDLCRERLEEKEESRVMFLELIEYTLYNGKISMGNMEYMIDALISLGEDIERRKEERGKIPRSHVAAFAKSLKFCLNAEDSNYIAILEKENEGSVEAYCLDPSIVLEPLRESSTIHISGTLKPIGTYEKITGFNGLPAKIIENVFPAENLKVGYVKGISTRFVDFNDDATKKMAEHIMSITGAIKRKTMIFFPSRRTMEKVMDYFEGEYLMDSGSLNQRGLMDLLERYRREDKPLCTVIGGRLSEGVNLPGELLELVIIAGIPYPKPDVKQRTLMAYYDMVFKNGWEYAVHFPTSVRLRQAIGRIIRSSEDRGVAVILDERAENFRDIIPGLALMENPVKEIEEFFRIKEESSGSG